MNRVDLIRNVCVILRETGVKKRVSPTKQTFHISDDEGNSKAFVVKTPEKHIIYNFEDIEAIFAAFVEAIESALRKGDEINIRGFGVLKLVYRKPRGTVLPNSDQWIDIAGRYVPKFKFGEDLKKCAKFYELSLEEKFSDAAVREEMIKHGSHFDDDDDEELPEDGE